MAQVNNFWALLIFLAFFLSGCVTTDYGKMDKSQIQQLPYNQLCENGAEVYKNIVLERKRRSFTCNYSDDFCRTQAGLKPKTEKYAECLIKVQGIQLQEQQNQQLQKQIDMIQLQQGLDMMERSRQVNQLPISRSTTTNCRNTLNGFTCNTF